MLRKHGEGRLSIPLITGRRAKRVYVQDVLERLNNQE